MNLVSTLFAWPTVVYTALLGVAAIYWLLAMTGLVDFENGLEMDADLGGDAAGDGADWGLLAGYLVAFGLQGVPFSIVFSLLAATGWFLTGMGSLLLPPLEPAWLSALVKTGVLIAAAALSVIISAQLVRPMRRLFVTHQALGSADLVGQTCKVLTGVVDARQGRAEVARAGASLNIRVWAQSRHSFSKGDLALITQYDAASHRYLIEPLS